MIRGKNTMETRQKAVDTGTSHNMTRQGVPFWYGHTEKRRHMTSRRRGREFQTVGRTERVSGLDRYRLGELR